MKRFLNNFIKKERNVIIYILLLSLLVFSIVPIVRTFYHDGILVGDVSYYNARMGNYLKSDPFLDQDPLTGKSYSFQPYHFILGMASAFMGMQWASILVPLFLGIISSLLLFKILERFHINKLTIFLTITFWIISPISIFVFSTSSTYSLAIFTFLLAFFLFTREKKIYHFLSGISFALLSFFSTPSLLFTIVVLYAYSIFKKEESKKAFLFIFFVIVMAFLNTQINLDMFTPISIENIISDFGALQGISVFVLILTSIGLYVEWRVNKYIIPNLLFLLLLTLTLFLQPILLYLNIVFALCTAYALTAFIVMKWKLKPLKSLTILIVVLSLLFSTISFTNRLAEESPDRYIIESLQFLNKNSEEKSNILSSSKNYYWIQTVSNRNPILSLESDNHLKNQTNVLFQTRNLNRAKELLKNLDIDYIYITPEMKTSSPWKKDDQGLLFLFRNDETFENIYEENNIEIWKVIKTSEIPS